MIASLQMAVAAAPHGSVSDYNKKQKHTPSGVAIDRVLCSRMATMMMVMM